MSSDVVMWHSRSRHYILEIGRSVSRMLRGGTMRLGNRSSHPTISKRWSFTMLFAMLFSIVSASLTMASPVQANTVGQGFTVTPSDLAYILQQIKIAEYHAANTTSLTGPCGALLGTGADQIPSPLLSFGLRTVDGSCNNLQSGQETFGAADQTFPRLATPVFNDAEDATFDPDGPGPLTVGTPTSYAQTSGSVFDSEPRMISNLIVDQTSTNPAAVVAAGYSVRSQGGGDPVVPCTSDPGPGDLDGTPNGCVPSFQTLFIANVTTDVGLSPPFNGLFTIFGQFFDHGLDKITNGGNGAVFVPLRADDPLIAGPNHIFGDSDDLAPNLRFMVLTRGSIVTGTDGFRNAPNTDTPFVDQSQTYTSHASHQIFLREYVNNILGRPVSTGKFLSSADGGLATWSMIKAQAATRLGLTLVDSDVGDIPMIASDPYGKFIPGPLRGLPQYVTASGLVEGNTAAPVAAPADVVRIGTAFLNDIAHSAAPTAGGPDADGVAGGSLDTPVPAGTYDNELLDIHFICGDGRCNENIALSAIHQIFHNEHDRLVDYIENVLLTDTSGITTLADWQSVNGAAGWNGERLFQAARFVTEMEYQHLVFEEFARKVQPAINPFEAFAFNQTDVDPAITAEFAHAVYRFGHSMLTETIDRVNANGSRNDIPLLDGFLNPASYTQATPNGPSGVLTSRQAATAIIMGMSDQTGNEIDEFVTETLRSNLLGLPLDLASLNMTRARSEGIPSLNNVRKQIYARTNDGQLAPYENWVAYEQAIRHPESLVNFIAAYGTHTNITTLDPDGAGPIVAGGLVARRTAADQIVNGTILPGPDGILGDNPATTGNDESLDDILPPADANDFMFSTGVWANTVGNVSITGVDGIDLWMGGLAENTLVFGGLLGSTFNYVFEAQLTNLQNGDRFYYLARTPGMNLRTQLEGNSFSELVMRNTDAVSLKADPFATADCKFNLGSNPGIATPGGSTVTDDPNSECSETALLIRQPNGEIRYRSVNAIDPPGINGQSVYSGTLALDRIFGGNDNDTFWGGLGNDVINGGGGDDVVLGGEGNDIITDLGGFDVLKGGPGNDAIDGGVNDDILMGGEGKDFVNGGANFNETFAGDGDDFVIAGQGIDGVFGDSGNDWIEGGEQPDLLIGDSSTLFFDDHNLPGHDILIGQSGDDDYDMEGGDDIGVAGPGVEKVAGASGWDWEIGLMDPQSQNADLALLVIGNPPANETRDRYNEIEALSGGALNDTLRGDDIIPSQVGGGGFIGCDALDANGVARITGLSALVPASIRTVDSAPIVAAATTNYCQLTGLVWGEGNILIGGAGSDILEGRGADDIIDGDRYLNVRLSIRANPDGTGAEIATAAMNTLQSAMTSIPTGSDWTGPLAGMTLQQAVFAGLIDAGQIVAVREILNPGPGTAIDTAVFSGARAGYTINVNTTGDLAGSVTVSDAAGAAVDGTDIVWNVERLQFTDQTVSFTPIISVAPTTLTFANTFVNTTSVSQAIIVSNTGFNPLTVSSVTRTGAGAAFFTATASPACATLAPGGSCTVTVAFAPTAVGPQSAVVNIASNDPSTPVLGVPVTGTAINPVISIAPSPLTFPARNVGTTSPIQNIVVTNTSAATINIAGPLTLSGANANQFVITNPNGCPGNLAAGASCNVGVRFAPTAASGAGVKTATITISSPTGGTVVATVTGTAVTPATIGALANIAFGNRPTGSTTTTTLAVTNTGTGTLNISGVTIAGSARFTANLGTCAAAVAPGGTCQINVTFQPINNNQVTATLTITSNASNNPRTVNLTGR
jgi:Ca2+-binding RTX toxin-like protein